MSEVKGHIQIISNGIASEVDRAMSLHASINSVHEAYGVIQEEFDEFWEEAKINPKKLSEVDQYIRKVKIRNELEQMAAMCIRAIIDLKLP